VDTSKTITAIGSQEIETRLRSLGDPERARVMQRFFKTGPGEYGEGDLFLGISVPETRKRAREYEALPLQETIHLLHSPIHEARLLALLIMVRAMVRACAMKDASLQEELYDAYLQNSRYINSWDLVDVSAEHIVGSYLRHRNRGPLYTLAASELIWERRIAVIATFHFIKTGEFPETLNIAEILLSDSQDLIQKAVGWMLREIGKRDRPAEEAFLQSHYRHMPRTMLRYAIERFPEDLRLQYLTGQI
jgi:3-methyladenine DNA glycosylase AlkD